ncbi:hypothetical protein KEM48_006820 [Puccinia striiformis f. sp. tritici PST-130]|nr:hypothetical protein KEM48_006820 [Puccinia striiformis f. sp. tritici PST-130]
MQLFLILCAFLVLLQVGATPNPSKRSIALAPPLVQLLVTRRRLPLVQLLVTRRRLPPAQHTTAAPTLTRSPTTPARAIRTVMKAR